MNIVQQKGEGGLSESKFPMEPKKSALVNIKGLLQGWLTMMGGKDKKCKDSDGDRQIGRQKAKGSSALLTNEVSMGSGARPCHSPPLI